MRWLWGCGVMGYGGLWGYGYPQWVTQGTPSRYPLLPPWATLGGPPQGFTSVPPEGHGYPQWYPGWKTWWYPGVGLPLCGLSPWERPWIARGSPLGSALHHSWLRQLRPRQLTLRQFEPRQLKPWQIAAAATRPLPDHIRSQGEGPKVFPRVSPKVNLLGFHQCNPNGGSTGGSTLVPRTTSALGWNLRAPGPQAQNQKEP